MIDAISLLASAVPLPDAAGYTRWESLGLTPGIDLGFFTLRWYSLAYLVGIFGGYLMLRRMLREPGAPMSLTHLDDLLLWGMMGVILGGRLGYVLFYQPGYYLANPGHILRLWDGGMSFHGGFLGVIAAVWWASRKHGLNFLRAMDWVAVIVPFGMLLGRLANFVNGELWGRVTSVPWALIFPADPTQLPRHPSQLYQAGLEGLALLIIMALLFWRTKARYYPGLMCGVFALWMGLARFFVEFFREPDAQLTGLVARTGLSMGQWLTIPLILIGLYLVATARRRRQRVEPFAGGASIA